MPKFARYISALLFCFIVLIVAVYAFEGSRIHHPAAVPVWQQDMSASVSLDGREQGLDIRGHIPVILENFGSVYYELNDEIESAINTLIDGARRIRARSITFDYEIFSTNQVVSVVLSATTRAVTDRTSVLSVNFNPRTGALMDLNQAMGRDITPLVEGKIAEMIRQNPATYYSAFTAPPTGQAFYVTDTSVVLLFDEFQLSSVPGATTQIELVLDNIRVFTVPRSDYYISEDRYAIKMMPLYAILTNMGYAAEWRNATKTIDIYLNGQIIMTLHPGVNNYQLNGVMQRSLEMAPEIRNGGTTYVPISFFDQILGIIIYNIDAQGNITFMNYLG